jgi:hypothetical protein
MDSYHIYKVKAFLEGQITEIAWTVAQAITLIFNVIIVTRSCLL